MISSVRWVSIATLALLTVASTCLAADPDTTGALPGRASIGGSLGLSYFGHTSGTGSNVDSKATLSNWSGPYSVGAEPRFSLAASFRYVMTRHLRWQVSPGFLWTGYSKRGIPAPMYDENFPTDPYKDHYLTIVAPAQAQIQYLIHKKPWLFHAGVGGGVYRLWVENHRKVLKDPVTFVKHTGVYPGASFEFGAEHFMKSLPNTSVEFVTDGHLVFAQDDKKFVSGLNSNVFAMGLRIGVNYYFPLLKSRSATQLPGLKSTK